MTATSFRCGPLAGVRWPGPGPTVVLLHAGVADSRCWEDVAPVLAERHDVLAYDRRGFGLTPPPQAGDPSHLADLLAVLDQEVEGPVWLAGNSMGGQLALEAVVAAPERVRGAVLVGSAISGAPWGELQDDPGSEALEERITAAADLEEQVRLHTWLWLDGPEVPEGRVQGPVRELSQDMCRTTLAHGLAEDAGSSGVDVWAALPSVAVPLVFAVGALDGAVLRELTTLAAARVPGARAAVLPGTAHLPSLDAPQELLALLTVALG